MHVDRNLDYDVFVIEGASIIHNLCKYYMSNETLHWRDTLLSFIETNVDTCGNSSLLSNTPKQSVGKTTIIVPHETCHYLHINVICQPLLLYLYFNQNTRFRVLRANIAPSWGKWVSDYTVDTYFYGLKVSVGIKHHSPSYVMCGQKLQWLLNE
jgi:hypothetical protein